MLIGKFSSAEVLYIFAATLFGASSDLWNDLGCAFAMHIGTILQRCFELTWGSFGWGIIALDIRLLCISVYTLRARKSAPQALHLAAKCAKHAEWKSERWKHMKAKAGHVQYYGLHLAGALWLGFDSDWILSFFRTFKACTFVLRCCAANHRAGLHGLWISKTKE